MSKVRILGPNLIIELREYMLQPRQGGSVQCKQAIIKAED